MRRLRPCALLAAWLLAACATAGPPVAAPKVQTARSASSAPKIGGFGFDVAGMDRTMRPGDDFNAYASGGWLKTMVIPPDRSSYGAFSALREIASRRTAAIIEEAAKSDASAGSEARKIGDYYASFMDETAIEAAGASPLKPELTRIAAIRTRKDLSREFGASLRADVDPLNATDLTTERLFGLWVAEDLNDTSRYRAYLLQGGLALPDRAYYLADGAAAQALRDKYKAHIATLLDLAGFDDVEARAGRVLALETAIARVHWSGVETTDVTKANTRWTPAQFAANAPGIDWPAFFRAAGLEGQPQVGAWQAGAITGIAKLVGSAPIETWKDYLAFHAAERGAPFLSRAFVDADFAFNSQVLSGTPQPPDRWKRGVERTNEALGEAVGRIYAQRWFPPPAKAEVQAMVANLVAAFDRRIGRLDWMSAETKARAREKLANLQVGVGYPDKWRDYSGLEVVRGDAYGNRQRAELFEYRRNLAKLGRAVDRQEWFMVPQEVNALNAPLQNSIIFPAAILAPPFFDPNADPAVNYGAIGAIIGHEISHGFDNTGALFDAKGSLHDWWTPADMARFTAAGKALTAQYSAYRPLPDAAVNGELTLGENIADLAGLASAYDAYHLSLGGTPAPVIDGFSGDQRLFLGWAQNYRVKAREAAMRRNLLTDVHAPGEFRADTVRNLDAWYEAFEVKPGDKLYLAPAERVRVW